MDAGAALVACWADCGLDTAFTVPGESFLPVLEALRQRREQFRTVSMRHEGGCTFAALAYGARARKPAVAMVSRGPGATNAAIGVHAAHQDSVPMILMIGHVRLHMRGRESFQEIDATSMFASMSKGVFQPETPEQVISMAREAIALSMAGRPGPVVLVMPRDLGEAPAPEVGAGENGAGRAALLPPPPAVAAMVERLSAAEKPLILAGELARDPEARPTLSALAHRLGAPVLAAYRCQDVLDNSDSAYAGHLEINPVAYQNEALAAADAILVLGSRLDGITSREEALLADRPDRLIHVYPDAVVLDRFASGLAVLADVAPSLSALTAALPAASGNGAWQSDLHQAYLRFSAPGGVAVQGNTDLAVLAESAGDNLPEGAIVLTDGGSFARWVHRYYRYRGPLTQGGSASGAMGASVPGAIGAALAAPDQPVVAFAGDGGFMMNGQELSTAVREGLKITVVVCDNQVHGSIISGQRAKYGDDKAYATVMGDPDFAALAEGYGAVGLRVARTEEWPAALAAALAADRPALIHVTCDAADIVPYGPGKDAV